MRDRMITIEEAAEIMQLKPHAVWQMVNAGQLPFIRLGVKGGSWRCSLSKLYDHLGLVGDFDEKA